MTDGRRRGPNRNGSLGVLIGGSIALIIGIVVWVSGQPGPGMTLTGVGAGIAAVGGTFFAGMARDDIS